MLFADYADKKWNWITAFDSKFYPDHFEEALAIYRPVIVAFRELADQAADSKELIRRIQRTNKADRIQLLRIFRRYVSPVTSVEMLKKKESTEEICRVFGPLFRPIEEVRQNINLPEHDIVLSALLF